MFEGIAYVVGLGNGTDERRQRWLVTLYAQLSVVIAPRYEEYRLIITNARRTVRIQLAPGCAAVIVISERGQDLLRYAPVIMRARRRKIPCFVLLPRDRRTVRQGDPSGMLGKLETELSFPPHAQLMLYKDLRDAVQQVKNGIDILELLQTEPVSASRQSVMKIGQNSDPGGVLVHSS